MTIYVNGDPVPPCPRCGTELRRWNREELLDDQYRPAVLNTAECPNPGCEWCTTLEQLVLELRPPRRQEVAA